MAKNKTFQDKLVNHFKTSSTTSTQHTFYTTKV